MKANSVNKTRSTLLASILLVASFTLSCTVTAHDHIVESTDAKNNHEAVQNRKKISPKEQIDFSKQDLAERLGISIDAVSVSGATPVTWRSGALGCPKPGMSYTQALVPGIWLLLKAHNVVYRYHAVPGGLPFYCPDKFAQPPATGSGAT